MKTWNRFLGLCTAALLLCGTLIAGALAAGPGELEVQLTYNGGGTGVNGAPVASGYAALLEDGAQVAVDNNLLTPITGGSVLFRYFFDPGKTYEVAVQEGMTAPYYEAKTFSVSPADIAAAISTGATVTDTVDWVEWSKPIKVSLEDSMGLPLATAGIDITIVATEADPSKPNYEVSTYQTVEITKSTDSTGTATFYDLSYDPSNKDMQNIHDNRFFITAKCGDTTVAQFYDLNALKSNCVTLRWPTATVSGVVRDSAGVPKANQRVAAYFQLMKPSSVSGGKWLYDGDVMAYTGSGPIKDYTSAAPGAGNELTTMRYVINFPLKGQVYYTTTDSSGNYTLALPEGVSATLCVDDADYAPQSQLSAPLLTINPPNAYAVPWASAINYDYIRKAFSHFPWLRSLTHLSQVSAEPDWQFTGLRCLELAPVSCTPYGSMAGYDLAMARTQYTLKGTVKAGNHLYNRKLSMTLTSVPPTLTTGLHRGGSAETAVAWDIVNGAINKTDVKLVPGTYTVNIQNDEPDNCDGYTPLTVTITAGDVSSGVVDLGVLNFAPIPKAPIVSTPGRPGTDVSKPAPKPPTAPNEGYGYLKTRLEKVEDLAHSGTSYELTLHYTAFHTNAAVNQVENAQLVVELPAGISVNHAGGMTVTGSSASGITLTQSFASLPTGETNAIVFSVRIDPTSASNYYAVTCKAAPYYGATTPQLTSALTLQRLKINLSAPRLLPPSTKFTVFGDITGAGESGVELNQLNGPSAGLVATGAKKGRYYYFDVAGQAAGLYQFQAETERDGVSETSSPVVVQVGSGLPEVKDMYLVAEGGRKISKNAAFQMVYYTAFVNSGNLAGPSFDVYVKVDGVLPTSTLEIQAMGLSFPATFDTATGYWKATVSNYAAYGDYDLMLSIDGTYTTQIGRLLLLF